MPMLKWASSPAASPSNGQRWNWTALSWATRSIVGSPSLPVTNQKASIAAAPQSPATAAFLKATTLIIVALDGEQRPRVQAAAVRSARRPLARLASLRVRLARAACAPRFHAAFHSAGKLEFLDLLVAEVLAALRSGFA